MARRRKGRDISGWLVVDKAAGVGSTTIVNQVRRALDAKKAGHAGTLDPAATGVLAVALGEATKTVPHVTEALKCYRFTVRFGVGTDTDDAEGRVIAESGARPEDAAIDAALERFRGAIMQVPPQYSAVRIDGERAYARARDGEAMEIAARPLFVERLELVERSEPDRAVFEMVCGKGGYVRAIARDLGAALDCPAHVETLRRVWSGPFDAAEAVSAEVIADEAGTPALEARLLPLETALADLPELRTTAAGAARMRNGNPAEVLTADAEFGDTAWASLDGRAVAIGTYRAGMLHPSRVFRT